MDVAMVTIEIKSFFLAVIGIIDLLGHVHSILLKGIN